MMLTKENVMPVIKTSPPVAVTTWYWVLGKDINWWISVVTLIYVALQTFFLIRKNLRARKRLKAEKMKS